MKLLFGLGNPGKEYEKTRHNIGAEFIDFIVEKEKLSYQSKFQSKYADIKINQEKFLLIKPETFMNHSGGSVIAFHQFYKTKTQDIFIIFDDLDINQGEYKIQFSKYPKSHNGVNDILEKINSNLIYFIRIGIEDKNSIQRSFMSGADYVLQKTDFNFLPVYEAIYKELCEKFV